MRRKSAIVAGYRNQRRKDAFLLPPFMVQS